MPVSQFLLNSAIKLTFSSQITMSLFTVPHLIVSKGQPTVFSRQGGRAVQDSTGSPQEGRAS